MKFLCWSISLLALIAWGTARILHPGNMDFPHHFFLLKYAIDIAFLNFAILMFIYPFLMKKGLVSVNFHDENEVGKARSILVIYSIILPGMALVCVAGFLAKIVPFVLIMILFGYVYLKNSYIIFVKNRTGRNGDRAQF